MLVQQDTIVLLLTNRIASDYDNNTNGQTGHTEHLLKSKRTSLLSTGVPLYPYHVTRYVMT